jgi:hypothetical protein
LNREGAKAPRNPVYPQIYADERRSIGMFSPPATASRAAKNICVNLRPSADKNSYLGVFAPLRFEI